MRIAVLGGTRFIGRAAVEQLRTAGHELLVIHRGEHEPPEEALAVPEVRHLHVDRRDLRSVKAEIHSFAPEVVVDTCAMDRADAEVATVVWPAEARLVVLSSCDVYRAYESMTAGLVTDPVPIEETAPLRAERFLYRGRGGGLDEYEKLDVESVYLDRGAVVLRLGFVYGPGDPQRREDFILRRVRGRRAAIPFGSGSWLLSRCFVEDAARAVRLAVEARGLEGEAFNVAERRSPTVRLWAEQILAAAKSDAVLVPVRGDQLPPDLKLSAEIGQPMLFDSSKLRRLLGWSETDPREALMLSVAWGLNNPPPGEVLAFEHDDRALAAGAD